MKLRRLNKSEDSRGEDHCPAMYLADDPAWMVCQGRHLDAETAGELHHVAPDEGGLAVPTETVLRAAALVLAEHDRLAMLAEVEAFLAERQEALR